MYSTWLKPALSDAKTFILDILFPISCLSCGVEGDFICPRCKSELTKLEHQRCIVCQKPTPFGLTHPACQTPHAADALISFYDYHDEKVAKIIIGGKYHFLPEVYKILGKIIAQQIKSHHAEQLNPTPLALSPIPLHATRKRWRGFNQAEILCQSLSGELNLPVADVLQRQKITKTQKDLKKEERKQNVAEAFKIKSGAKVKAQNFILIDDVTTTGSTLLEVAKILKRNGAEKVICLTVARD